MLGKDYAFTFIISLCCKVEELEIAWNKVFAICTALLRSSIFSKSSRWLLMVSELISLNGLTYMYKRTEQSGISNNIIRISTAKAVVVTWPMV